MDHFSGFVYTALLEWVSEYAVQAYTTSDSVVSYLNDVRIASTTPSFAVWRTTAAKSCENSKPIRGQAAEFSSTVKQDQANST